MSHKNEALREHYAGLAMVALIAKAPAINAAGKADCEEIMAARGLIDGIARGAVAYADALIAELDK